MVRRLYQIGLVAAIVISLGGWFWLLGISVHWLIKAL
jgi:hypothetical protein